MTVTKAYSGNASKIALELVWLTVTSKEKNRSKVKDSKKGKF